MRPAEVIAIEIGRYTAADAAFSAWLIITITPIVYIAGINVRTAAIIFGNSVCIGRAERRNALPPPARQFHSMRFR